jgi:hypothetical protein
MGMDARVSAFNRDFPDEPKFDAHGTDFRELSGRSRPYWWQIACKPDRNGIRSNPKHRAWCARRKATYKQDCHSLRSMTAQGQSRRVRMASVVGVRPDFRKT